jgi:6,7-dimethyl-8-ribityllumazine synthase
MSDWKRPSSGSPPLKSEGGPRVLQGKPDASRYRVAIVAAVFNDTIVTSLIDGAAAAWAKHGGAVEKLLIARVPGAFELPVAARALAKSGGYDAIVALGCVIRGDTPHFEYVAGESARGLQQIGCDAGIPVIFGVLTVSTYDQAHERASLTGGNKGGESMEVALEMADLLTMLK